MYTFEDGIHIGTFAEHDHGGLWQYRDSKRKWGIENGYPHEIAWRDGHHSPADVREDIAYVVVDWDAFDNPEVEEWIITHIPKK